MNCLTIRGKHLIARALIDTLIAIVSVIRPGTTNEGKKLAFSSRFQGLEPVRIRTRHAREDL